MIRVRLACGHARWVSLGTWLDCRGMRTWHLLCRQCQAHSIARTPWRPKP